MTNDTSLESSCALLLESAKNLQICKNWIFNRKIQFYSTNVFKKKFVKKMKNYTFLKSPWPCHFKYAKILKNLIFNEGKLKMCKFPLTGCLQKICNFFRKTCAIRFLCQKLSKKLNFIKIWQVGQNQDLVCYRKKQSFWQCAWGPRQ